MPVFFAPSPMELLIVGLLCALFAGVPLVLVTVLLVTRRNSGGGPNHYGRVPCPECGEQIVAEAIKCRFCGATVNADDVR